MNKEIFLTEELDKARKTQLRKLANHFNYSNCEVMDKPLDNFDEFIEKENALFQLETVIKNKAKKCSNNHNGDIAVYKLFKGAIGYDN